MSIDLTPGLIAPAGTRYKAPMSTREKVSGRPSETLRNELSKRQ